MKQIIALVLSLCLLMPVAVMAASAETGYTLTLQGEGVDERMTGDTAYTLPTPALPTGKVFAGWQGRLGEKDVFLPAGAEVTLTADATLTALFVGIEMRKKPELRLNVKGLRFLTDINKAELTALQQAATVGFGTVIAPEDYLASGQHLSAALLADAEKLYLDVGSIGAYSETEETVTIAGSIGNVFEKNFCRVFLAAGYLSLTYTDGSTGRVYAPVKRAAGGTYLYTLALTAFQDRVQKQDEGHPHSADGGYSPYTATELSFLKRVLDTTVNLSLELYSSGSIKKIHINPQLDYYAAPYTAKYDANNEWIQLTVKEGSAYRFHTDYNSTIVDGGVRECGRGESKKITVDKDGLYLRIPYSYYSAFY